MSKKKTILYSDSDWRREITQSHKFFEQALTTYSNEIEGKLACWDEREEGTVIERMGLGRKEQHEK